MSKESPIVMHPMAQEIVRIFRSGIPPENPIVLPWNEREETVHITLRPDFILIRDLVTNDVRFIMTSHDFGNLKAEYGMDMSNDLALGIEPNDRIMQAAIYSMDGVQHHPYIYASVFLQEGFRFFQSHHHQAGFLGVWLNDGVNETNYRQFMTALHDLPEDAARDPRFREKAAWSTWTGRQAAKMGFTRASELTNQYPQKRVRFMFY